MNAKDFTKDDIRNAYRIFLGREPESEAVVEHHFNRCSKLSDLLQTFYRSPESQNKIKKTTLIQELERNNSDRELSPVLPLPKGVTERQLFDFVLSIRVQDGPEEELKAYGTEAFRRIVYTWGVSKGHKRTMFGIGSKSLFYYHFT
jgi:hypothetical protein